MMMNLAEVPDTTDTVAFAKATVLLVVLLVMLDGFRQKAADRLGKETM